jgi:hypothetical protein
MMVEGNSCKIHEMNVKNIRKSFYKCGVARKYSKSKAQSAKAVTSPGELRPGRGVPSSVCGYGVGPASTEEALFPFVRMTA